MTLDTEQEEVRVLLGERLRRYREAAHLSVNELGKAIGRGRQYVYLMQDGKANFGINDYVAALRACGVSFQEFLSAMQTSDIPEDDRPFHEMLSEILSSRNKDLVQGIRVNLEAISRMVRSLQRERASPRPEPGRVAGEAEGSGHKRKRKPA